MDSVYWSQQITAQAILASNSALFCVAIFYFVLFFSPLPILLLQHTVILMYKEAEVYSCISPLKQEIIVCWLTILNSTQETQVWYEYQKPVTQI